MAQQSIHQTVPSQGLDKAPQKYISRASLDKIPTSFASCSLGPPNNLPDLFDRLDAIQKAGFDGIELSFPDILSHGKKLFKRDIDPKDFDTICEVAKDIKKKCDELGLVIMMLQPFSNFEGWQAGSEKREDAYERARGWIRIMETVGCDLLQVGSTDSDIKSLDLGAVKSDLQALADMLGEHNYGLAYENWCWSTHAPGWREVWEHLKNSDRNNFWLCLDTFQTAGGEWADPTTESGLIEKDHNGASLSQQALQDKFKRSLEDLSKTIPKDKIRVLQVSDAYKMNPPLSPEPDDQGLRPRGGWSHDYRPLPLSGGYLPVVDVAKAVLKTGYRGWFSYEVFDGGSDGKKTECDIYSYAKSAMEVHKKLLDACAEEPPEGY